MKTWWSIVGALFVVIVLGVLALVFIPAPKAAAPAANPLNDMIVVDNPAQGGAVASPLTVTGKARGNWYFEATFPVELKDAGGNVIAQGPAQAQGDWMTTNFVQFSAPLTFPPQSAGSTGTLILKNDNPSGDPANQKELDIPVTF